MAKKSATDIRNRSIEIHKAARLLGKDIQSHLVDIAKHILSVESNGDVSLATHFVTLLNEKKEGESRSVIRSVAVKNWLETFSACVWGKDKSGKEGFKLNKDMRNFLLSNPKDMTIHMKDAATTKWNELTPEKPFVSFDLNAAIAALIKRAEDKLGEEVPEGQKGHKIDTAKLELLKTLAE